MEALAKPIKRSSLREHLVDELRMLSLFQRQLPAMAQQSLRVSRCRIRPSSRRNGSHAGRNRIVYEVTVEASRGARWEHTIVATAPVSPDFLGPELLHLSRTAGEYPAARPFTQLAAYVDDLEMVLLILPVDPALPGLAEITGPGRGRLLTQHIRDCHDAIVRRADCTIRRYIPAQRCELAFTITIEAPGGVTKREVRVHVFADDRGRLHHENMEALWPAVEASEHLRIPQPLGYDPDHRLLFTASGGDNLLRRWVRRIERDKPLPAGVDLRRVRQCVTTAARALGELQRADLSPSEECTYRGVLAPLHRSVRMMRSAHAGAAPDFELLLESLSAQPIGEEKLVPAHGRFGPDRLAGDENKMAILDWGRMCLASPALDAASFLGRLRCAHLCRPTRGRGIEHLADVFRREFLAGGPAVTPDELAAYEALLLARQAVRIARHPLRGGGGATRPVRRLLRTALQHLEVPRTRYHGSHLEPHV